MLLLVQHLDQPPPIADEAVDFAVHFKNEARDGLCFILGRDKYW